MPHDALALDPKTTAVLVIDLLVSKGTDAVYNPDPAEQVVVDQATRVVDAARAAGMPVIFCDDAHLPGIDRELALWGEHGVAGSTEPNPALRAGSGPRDFVITKRRYSGFFGTDLDLTLRELGVTTLVAVGEDTNICVLHTLADAFYLGYRTVLAEEATRTFLCGTQEGALDHMRKCFGTTVTSVEQVLAALA